jgi:hypothetical protein
LPSKNLYTVYASVYHLPPPNQIVKADYVLVFDQKKRLVASLGGGTVGRYGGRYSKKRARIAVARHLYGFGVSNISEKDVHIITSNQAKELRAKSKRGGFQVFISIENVPKEKTIYVKAIYLLEFGNRPWKESERFDMIRTSGEDAEDAVKKLISRYLKKRYDYVVEPEEIHFLREKDREKFEALTA